MHDLDDITGLLRSHLELTVPIEMDNLRKKIVDEELIEEARARLAELRKPEMAEAIMFRSEETKEALIILTECLAVMAYIPGGVRFLGIHFEARGSQPVYAHHPIPPW
jgi:hypothetical protein